MLLSKSKLNSFHLLFPPLAAAWHVLVPSVLAVSVVFFPPQALLLVVSVLLHLVCTGLLLLCLFARVHFVWFTETSAAFKRFCEYNGFAQRRRLAQRPSLSCLFSIAGVIITHFPLLQLLLVFACYSVRYLKGGLVITWTLFCLYCVQPILQQGWVMYL